MNANDVATAMAAGIVWRGDDLFQSPSAEALLASIPPGWEPTGDLLNFYNGDQWHPDVLERRQGRPCLVVNMLPRLYALAWQASSVRVDCYDRGAERLKCWITHRNMEAQRLYNYMVSAAAEVAVEASPNGRVLNTTALGHAVHAAYQDALRNRKDTAVIWAEAGMAAIDYYLKAERA